MADPVGADPFIVLDSDADIITLQPLDIQYAVPNNVITIEPVTSPASVQGQRGILAGDTPRERLRYTEQPNVPHEPAVICPYSPTASPDVSVVTSYGSEIYGSSQAGGNNRSRYSNGLAQTPLVGYGNPFSSQSAVGALEMRVISGQGPPGNYVSAFNGPSSAIPSGSPVIMNATAVPSQGLVAYVPAVCNPALAFSGQAALSDVQSDASMNIYNHYFVNASSANLGNLINTSAANAQTVGGSPDGSALIPVLMEDGNVGYTLVSQNNYQHVLQNTAMTTSTTVSPNSAGVSTIEVNINDLSEVLRSAGLVARTEDSNQNSQGTDSAFVEMAKSNAKKANHVKSSRKETSNKSPKKLHTNNKAVTLSRSTSSSKSTGTSSTSGTKRANVGSISISPCAKTMGNISNRPAATMAANTFISRAVVVSGRQKTTHCVDNLGTQTNSSVSREKEVTKTKTSSMSGCHRANEVAPDKRLLTESSAGDGNSMSIYKPLKPQSLKHATQNRSSNISSRTTGPTLSRTTSTLPIKDTVVQFVRKENGDIDTETVNRPSKKSTSPVIVQGSTPHINVSFGTDSGGKRVAYINNREASNVIDLTESEKEQSQNSSHDIPQIVLNRSMENCSRTQRSNNSVQQTNSNNTRIDNSSVQLSSENLSGIQLIHENHPASHAKQDNQKRHGPSLISRGVIKVPALVLKDKTNKPTKRDIIRNIKLLTLLELQSNVKDMPECAGVAHTFCTLTGIHKKYLCNVCSFKTEDVQAFVMHFKKEHVFKCVTCHKLSLSRRDNLEHTITCHPESEKTGVECLSWDGANIRYKDLPLSPSESNAAPLGIEDPLPKDANQFALPVKLTNKYNDNFLDTFITGNAVETCSTDSSGRLTMSSFDIENKFYYFCPRCTMDFDCIEALMTHMRAVHDVLMEVILKKEVNGARPDVSSVRQYLAKEKVTIEQGVPEGGLWGCNVCPFLVLDKASLLRHMREEHDKPPVSDAASKAVHHASNTASDKAALNSGQGLQDAGLTCRWICFYCKWETSTRDIVIAHIKAYHPKLKMLFVCKPQQTEMAEKQNKAAKGAAPDRTHSKDKPQDDDVIMTKAYRKPNKFDPKPRHTRPAAASKMKELPVPVAYTRQACSRIVSVEYMQPERNTLEKTGTFEVGGAKRSKITEDSTKRTEKSIVSERKTGGGMEYKENPHQVTVNHDNSHVKTYELGRKTYSKVERPVVNREKQVFTAESTDKRFGNSNKSVALSLEHTERTQKNTDKLCELTGKPDVNLATEKQTEYTGKLSRLREMQKQVGNANVAGGKAAIHVCIDKGTNENRRAKEQLHRTNGGTEVNSFVRAAPLLSTETLQPSIENGTRKRHEPGMQVKTVHRPDWLHLSARGVKVFGEIVGVSGDDGGRQVSVRSEINEGKTETPKEAKGYGIRQGKFILQNVSTTENTTKSPNLKSDSVTHKEGTKHKRKVYELKDLEVKIVRLPRKFIGQDKRSFKVSRVLMNLLEKRSKWLANQPVCTGNARSCQLRKRRLVKAIRTNEERNVNFAEEFSCKEPVCKKQRPLADAFSKEAIAEAHLKYQEKHRNTQQNSSLFKDRGMCPMVVIKESMLKTETRRDTLIDSNGYRAKPATLCNSPSNRTVLEIDPQRKMNNDYLKVHQTGQKKTDMCLKKSQPTINIQKGNSTPTSHILKRSHQSSFASTSETENIISKAPRKVIRENRVCLAECFENNPKSIEGYCQNGETLDTEHEKGSPPKMPRKMVLENRRCFEDDSDQQEECVEESYDALQEPLQPQLIRAVISRGSERTAKLKAAVKILKSKEIEKGAQIDFKYSDKSIEQENEDAYPEPQTLFTRSGTWRNRIIDSFGEMLNTDDRYTCKKCSQGFVTIDDVKDHFLTKHQLHSRICVIDNCYPCINVKLYLCREQDCFFYCKHFEDMDNHICGEPMESQPFFNKDLSQNDSLADDLSVTLSCSNEEMDPDDSVDKVICNSSTESKCLPFNEDAEPDGKTTCSNDTLKQQEDCMIVVEQSHEKGSMILHEQIPKALNHTEDPMTDDEKESTNERNKDLDMFVIESNSEKNVILLEITPSGSSSDELVKKNKDKEGTDSIIEDISKSDTGVNVLSKDTVLNDCEIVFTSDSPTCGNLIQSEVMETPKAALSYCGTSRATIDVQKQKYQSSYNGEHLNKDGEHDQNDTHLPSKGADAQTEDNLIINEHRHERECYQQDAKQTMDATNNNSTNASNSQCVEVQSQKHKDFLHRDDHTQNNDRGQSDASYNHRDGCQTQSTKENSGVGELKQTAEEDDVLKMRETTNNADRITVEEKKDENNSIEEGIYQHNFIAVDEIRQTGSNRSEVKESQYKTNSIAVEENQRQCIENPSTFTSEIHQSPSESNPSTISRDADTVSCEYTDTIEGHQRQHFINHVISAENPRQIYENLEDEDETQCLVDSVTVLTNQSHSCGDLYRIAEDQRHCGADHDAEEEHKRQSCADHDAEEEHKRQSCADHDAEEEHKRQSCADHDAEEEHKRQSCADHDAEEEHKRQSCADHDAEEEHKRQSCADHDAEEEHKRQSCADHDAEEEHKRQSCADHDAEEEHKRQSCIDPDATEEHKRQRCADPDAKKEHKRQSCADPDSKEEHKRQSCADHDAEEEHKRQSCTDPDGNEGDPMKSRGDLDSMEGSQMLSRKDPDWNEGDQRQCRANLDAKEEDQRQKGDVLNGSEGGERDGYTDRDGIEEAQSQICATPDSKEKNVTEEDPRQSCVDLDVVEHQRQSRVDPDVNEENGNEEQGRHYAEGIKGDQRESSADSHLKKREGAEEKQRAMEENRAESGPSYTDVDVIEEDQRQIHIYLHDIEGNHEQSRADPIASVADSKQNFAEPHADAVEDERQSYAGPGGAQVSLMQSSAGSSVRVGRPEQRCSVHPNEHETDKRLDIDVVWTEECTEKVQLFMLQ